MGKKQFIIWILCFHTVLSQAQDQIHMLNQYTPLRYNPAYSAMDNDASASFLNKSAKVSNGLTYHNNVFTAEYPLIIKETGKRYGGIGIHFLEKDAGDTDLLKTISAALSVAYNLQILPNQFISFGMQTSYNNKQASYDNLTSGSQWIANEFNFDPNADLGEPTIDNRLDYFGINSGLTWYLKEKDVAAPKAYFSIASFNMNRPQNSFFGEKTRAYARYMVNGGAVLYQKNNFKLTPQLFYQLENSHSSTNLILSGELFLMNNNPYDIIKSGSMEILAKYGFDYDLNVGAVFKQPGYSVGFSYNIPLSSNNLDNHLQSGFEFGLKVSKTIWKAKPKVIVLEDTKIPETRDFNFGDKGSTDEKIITIREKSDTDIIRENIENLSGVNAVQFELEENFNYDLGKAELDGDAMKYLDELYELLKSNPNFKLDVQGHTDNIGKPFLNYTLSTERARVVADYLIRSGLDKEKVTFKGMGDTLPVAENDNEENRKKNRRVVFVIYLEK